MEQILKVLLEIKKELNKSSLQNKEVLSLQQFCKYADISDDHGYKLIRERKIKFYRPGGKKIYIDREDVIAYLKQNPGISKSDVERLATTTFLTSKTNNHGNN